MSHIHIWKSFCMDLNMITVLPSRLCIPSTLHDASQSALTRSSTLFHFALGSIRNRQTNKRRFTAVALLFICSASISRWTIRDQLVPQPSGRDSAVDGQTVTYVEYLGFARHMWSHVTVRDMANDYFVAMKNLNDFRWTKAAGWKCKVVQTGRSCYSPHIMHHTYIWNKSNFPVPDSRIVLLLSEVRARWPKMFGSLPSLSL